MSRIVIATAGLALAEAGLRPFFKQLSRMTLVPDAAMNAIPPCPDHLGGGGDAIQDSASRESLFWRQFRAAGLEAIAEKVSAGRALEFSEAVALSQASLPLLGKLVEMRPAAEDASRAAAPGSLPIDRATTLPDSPRIIGQPLADWAVFCRTLMATRDDRSSNGRLRAWIPLLEKPLDQEIGCDGGFTGVEVLRAIALARLVLPAEIEVRAPLAMLGPKLAQVALDFGASHLGCVALDGQTPGDPLVAESSLLDELSGSCPPTSLREEA